MNNSVHDVIVLGGGPAGLGSAIHLAEKGLSVLLLEKGKIGGTQKTWLTFDHVIREYALEPCIRNRCREIVFSCYLGNSYTLKRNDFIFPIREEMALSLLAQKAIEKGAVIRQQEPFVNYAVNKNGGTVTLKTTKGAYEARLGVDAMGRSSQLLRSQGLRNETLDMGCLVFYLKKVNHKNDNRLYLYDSFFPGPDYFWLVPLEEDQMMIGVFSFSPLTSENIKSKSEKLRFYMEARKIQGEICETRMGNIPLGPQAHVNTERFLCIGDSANTPLPSSGFSFSRCIDESKVLADFAADYLSGKARIKDYKREILGRKIPGIEVHLMISDMLAHFTDPMLNQAIGAMNKLNEDFLISFLTGRDMSIAFSITALRAILNTFSLSEISELSLKPHHLKNLINLYNLLPAISKAKLGEQLVQFVRGIVKNRYPQSTR